MQLALCARRLAISTTHVEKAHLRPAKSSWENQSSLAVGDLTKKKKKMKLMMKLMMNLMMKLLKLMMMKTDHLDEYSWV